MGFDGQFADKPAVGRFGSSLLSTAADVRSSMAALEELKFDVPGVRSSAASATFAVNVDKYLGATADKLTGTGQGVLKAGKAWGQFDKTTAREYTAKN